MNALKIEAAIKAEQNSSGCPSIRAAWLLGLDDYMTIPDAVAKPLEDSLTTKNKQMRFAKALFDELLPALYIQFSQIEDTGESGETADKYAVRPKDLTDFDPLICGEALSKWRIYDWDTGEEAFCSLEEKARFCEDVLCFVTSWLSRMKRKGRADNG